MTSCSLIIAPRRSVDSGVEISRRGITQNGSITKEQSAPINTQRLFEQADWAPGGRPLRSQTIMVLTPPNHWHAEHVDTYG